MTYIYLFLGAILALSCVNELRDYYKVPKPRPTKAKVAMYFNYATLAVLAFLLGYHWP